MPQVLMASDDLKPWHRWPDEPRKAYHCFLDYMRIVSFERSMDRAYAVHRTMCQSSKNPQAAPTYHGVPPNWKVWKLRFNWEGRADAHDAVLAEADRQKRVREIEAMNARQASLALAMQNLILAKLTRLV